MAEKGLGAGIARPEDTDPKWLLVAREVPILTRSIIVV